MFTPSLRLALTLSAMVPLAACGSNAAPPPAAEAVRPVSVAQASVSLNPNRAAPSAAYFTLTGGSSEQVLTGIASPAIERAELHESRLDGGMLSMAPLPEVPVPAGGSVEFRPGGKHVMLFGISDEARSAGRLTLTLAFRDGQTLPVELAFPSQSGAMPVATPAAEAEAEAAPAAAPAQGHEGH